MKVKERSNFGVIRAVDADARRISGIASHEKIDRYGEIVRVSGIDTKNFLKNPVLLSSHDRNLVIGRVTRLWIEKIDGADALLFDGEGPPPGVSAVADEVWTLIASGILKGISIGFLGNVFEPAAKGSGGVWTSVELLEISAVSLPACPSCLLQKSACACQHADPNEVVLVLDERARRDVIESTPAWPMSITHALADITDYLASLDPAERERAKFDPLREAADALEAFLLALTNEALGRTVRTPTHPGWHDYERDSSWRFRNGRRRTSDDIGVRLANAPDDVLDVDLGELPSLIATSLRNTLAVEIGSTLRSVLNEARGRISD